MYALYSIAEHVDIDEGSHLARFMELLGTIPYDRLHEKVLGTALDCIGMHIDTSLSNLSTPSSINGVLTALNSMNFAFSP